MQSRIKIIPIWSAALLLVLLPACGHVATAQNHGRMTSLAIVGYNYTNRSIGSLSIDGQGGGNIHVSSPTSGGGGIVCCALYHPDAKITKVRVRWQSDGCYFSRQYSMSKQMHDVLYRFYKEQDAPLEVLAASDPQYMEVHFYPDGSIKAAITSELSLPRLSLDQRRQEQNPYPRCPNDQEPKE